MKMKKILFVLSSYDIGGTTVSTRHLISILDKTKYEITLWVLHPEGILQWMYEGVRTIPTCFSAQALALAGWKHESNWMRRIGAAVIRFGANHFPFLHQAICRHAIRKCTRGQHYDTVVACQEGSLSAFVAHFDCPNKVAWVRCDYKRYYEGRHEQKELFYNKYHHIVCVAEQACKSFIDIYPELKDRTVCIYNPQDSKLIVSQADIDDHDERFHTDGTVIVSVGRISKVKRFVEIPSIARGLIDKGYKFVWYIIGDGEERFAIADAIEQQAVGNRVIMLGAKSNPHFYIKRADLYVCLSSSEACPRVINEAKILGTPVISTDFPTVYEYLEDGLNGRIVSLENMPQAIIDLLTNEKLYLHIKEEIGRFSFDNNSLINQLEKIL